MTDRYKNKYFSILGDSLSTFSGYNPSDCAVFYDLHNKRLAQIYSPSDTWWGCVSEALGGKVLVNDSWAGSTVCKLKGSTVDSHACSDTRTGRLGFDGINPDVIMVLIGINDWGYSKPLTSEDENSTYCFIGAYRTMLKKLKNNYPEAEIWCFTLPCIQREWVTDTSKKHAFSDYCDIIRKCASEEDCILLDIYDPDFSCETVDEVHPNYRGMLLIADKVLNEIERNIKSK